MAAISLIFSLFCVVSPAYSKDISFLGYSDSDIWRNYWSGAIKRFEATHSGIHVNQLGNDQLSIKKVALNLKTLFDAGAAPDLYIAAIAHLGTGVENNWATPLDDYVAKWPDKDDIIDAVYKRASKNGIVYGIGHKPDAILFVYRKDYFKEAGMDPENPPQTWEGLAAAAEKLTVRKNGRVIRSGLTIPSDLVPLITVLARQNGGDYLDADGNPAIDDKAWIEALEFLTDLVRIKKVNIITHVSEHWTPDNLFLTGQSAISMLLPYQISILRQNGLGDKIGIINLKRKIQTEWSGAWILHISSQSKKKKDAWEFIKFVMTPDEMWLRYKQTENPVVRKSMMDRYFADDPFLNKAQMKGIDIGSGAAKVSWFGTLFTNISQAMEEAFHEGKAPAAALQDAQARVMIKLSTK